MVVGRAAVAEGVEYDFNPAGNSQLVENPEQVVLDGVFRQLQTFGSLAIGKSFGHASYYVGFAG